jgi:hypothetical protein
MVLINKITCEQQIEEKTKENLLEPKYLSNKSDFLPKFLFPAEFRVNYSISRRHKGSIAK